MARKKKGRAIDGILLLDKPLGISSSRALQIVKRLFNAQKAGHTGSLDPLASGMLPICLGEATKVSAFLLESNKTYLTTATLGKTTSTGDAEGEILSKSEVPKLNDKIIATSLDKFKGEISQTPPMYSALKHKGQPLYKLARQGIEIERKTRTINIFDIVLHEQTEKTLTLEVSCSKGTYIRTLVEDIGHDLGCGAYVSMLRRTTVTPFENYKMTSLETLTELAEAGDIDSELLSIDSGLSNFPAVTLNEENTALYMFGQTVTADKPNPTPKPTYLRTYSHSGLFLGVSTPAEDNKVVPKRLMTNQNS